MDDSTFRKSLEEHFGLTFSIEKHKHAYAMVQYADGTGGDVAGEPYGHSHNCSIPHFSYKGWVYALIDGGWYTMPDGISGWRQTETNPFPQCPLHAYRSLWERSIT